MKVLKLLFIFILISSLAAIHRAPQKCEKDEDCTLVAGEKVRCVFPGNLKSAEGPSGYCAYVKDSSLFTLWRKALDTCGEKVVMAVVYVLVDILGAEYA
jgi:hypothetical protein